MANCNVSFDTSLYKDVRTMTSQLAECTAKLAAREQEAASKNGLLRQYESEIKTMREQVATMLHPAPQPNPPATDTFAINVNNKLPLIGGVEQLHALQNELVSVRESAQGRMAQLKALLDEKNATIERYRQKLLQTGAHNLSDDQIPYFEILATIRVHHFEAEDLILAKRHKYLFAFPKTKFASCRIILIFNII